MLEYTRIAPPMKITAARDNFLHGTAVGILLVVVRGTDDVLRTVKFPIVLVPVLKRNLFYSSTEFQKCVKTTIEKNDSYLDLKAFSVQLARLDSIDYLDLINAKENRT